MTTNQNITITPESVQTAGAVSYWRLSGPVNLAALTNAWKLAGLNVDMLPRPPGDDVALGRAVHEEEGRIRGRAARAGQPDDDSDVRRLVRSLARRGAWALVEETRANDTLHYSTLLSVVSGKAGAPVFTRVDASSVDYEAVVARIRANYDKRRGEIEPTDVSSWLVKIANKLQSVPLRDTGGIYFVPRNDIDVWRKVVEAITTVSAHRVFSIPALRNSEAIDAITDAISQEAESISVALEAELGKTGDDALGAKALQTRQESCELLLQKISAYDKLLDTQLKCRDRVERLQAAIVSAAISQAA